MQGEFVDPQDGIIQVGFIIKQEDQVTAFLVDEGSPKIDRFILTHYGQGSPVFDRIKTGNILTIKGGARVIQGKVDFIPFPRVTIAEDIADNGTAIGDIRAHRAGCLAEVHGDTVALDGRATFHADDATAGELTIDLNGWALLADDVGAVDVDVAGDGGAFLNQNRRCVWRIHQDIVGDGGSLFSDDDGVTGRIIGIANFCRPGSIIEGRDNGGIKEKVLVFIHVITSALAIFIDELETRAYGDLKVVVLGFLIAIFGFDFLVIIFSHKAPLIINRIS